MRSYKNDYLNTGMIEYKNGNYENAIHNWELALKEGNSVASYNLAECYENGYGVIKDERKAISLYKQAAEAGVAAAQYIYGKYCLEGHFVQHNEKEGLEWLRKSAEQWYPNAISLLAMKQETVQSETNSVQSETNSVQSETNFVQPETNSVQPVENEDNDVIDISTPELKYKLAQRIKESEGDERDMLKYLYYVEMSAKEGYKEAQVVMGQVYDKGFGVDRNIDKAVYWYEKAAAQGETSAREWLKENYVVVALVKKAFENHYNMVREEKEEISDTMSLIARAKKGDYKSQEELARRYSLADEKEKSIKWYKSAFSTALTAAEAGDAEAQYYLGNKYILGEKDVIEINMEKHFYWLEKAANNGHLVAMECLAFDSKSYSGYEDLEKSRYWFEKAFEINLKKAEQGDAAAQYYIGKAFYDGEDISEDKEKAAYWLEKAATQGLGDAMYSMGWVCYNSNNKETANEWWRKAAVHGNEWGMYYFAGDSIKEFKKRKMNIYEAAYFYYSILGEEEIYLPSMKRMYLDIMKLAKKVVK